jgi:hypothetical protein
LPPWLYRALRAAASALAALRRRIVPAQYAALELGTGSWIAFALAAFCELHLPEALDSGAKTPRELAALGCGDEAMLFRLLRALCGYGVVRRTGPHRFELDRIGRALTGENSVATMIRYANTPWHAGAYTRLTEAIRAGKPGFDLALEQPLFQYLSANARDRALFDEAMESLVPLSAKAFANAYDFSGVSSILDIGGGTGLLLAALRERYPHLQTGVFELPEHDILKETPPPADAYILSHVLHDWDDDTCARMLQNVRAAITPQSRLLVHEIVVAEGGNAWSQDRLTDLEMMAMLSGRERTRAEFAALFERCGLQLIRVIDTAAAESVLEVRLADD